MKHTPHKNFENGQPAFDFRYLLSENQPLSVRFVKALLNRKWKIMGTCAAFTAAVFAIDHGFENVASCDIVYNQNTAWFWQDPQYQRMRAHIDTDKHSMIDVFHECGRFLNTMDGDDRVFIDYESDSGIAIPGIELIEGSTIDVGLHGAQLMETNPQKRLEEAIAQNASDQRWLVENYMSVAGHKYEKANAQYMRNQAQYETSDTIKYSLWDAGDWFKEKGREASSAISRMIGAPTKIPDHNPN